MQNKYAEIPKFSQIVEYITQAAPVDGVYGVVINSVALDQLDISQPQTLDTVMSEIKMVASLKRAPDVVKTEPNLKPIPAETLKAINEKLVKEGGKELAKEATWEDFNIGIKTDIVVDPKEKLPIEEKLPSEEKIIISEKLSIIK